MTKKLWVQIIFKDLPSNQPDQPQVWDSWAGSPLPPGTSVTEGKSTDPVDYTGVVLLFISKSLAWADLPEGSDSQGDLDILLKQVGILDFDLEAKDDYTCNNSNEAAFYAAVNSCIDWELQPACFSIETLKAITQSIPKKVPNA